MFMYHGGVVYVPVDLQCVTFDSDIDIKIDLMMPSVHDDRSLCTLDHTCFMAGHLLQ